MAADMYSLAERIIQEISAVLSTTSVLAKVPLSINLKLYITLNQNQSTLNTIHKS